jgi:hypothetical protein
MAERINVASIEQASSIATPEAIDTGVAGQKSAVVDRRIELLPPNGLIPYEGNARTHSKKQVRQIADSIIKFGFNNPVLIDDDGGIIAGHGRVAAAKLLSLAAVPALRLSHLSEAEKKAYIIADNRLAELAGWDREVLAIELQGLTDLDFEVEVTGYETGEIDIVLADPDDAKAEAAAPEDEVPEPHQGPITSWLGDVWVLGKHRLLCGDARDADAYHRLLDGQKAEFVFADPPYNVAVEDVYRGSIDHREFAMASGEMTADAFTDFLRTVFRNLAGHATDGSLHDICMDWRHLTEMMAAGSAVYTELTNLCVWAKTHPGMGGFYRSQHELIFVWKSGAGQHVNNIAHGQHGRSRGNVWSYAGLSSMVAGRREAIEMHPTVKPVALVADAIKDCSRRNGIILDPFVGSGTTLIAAERTGRRGRGIEIDPGYVDVAVRRWQTYTGKTATLVATGQSFNEIAEVRGQLASPITDQPNTAPETR